MVAPPEDPEGETERTFEFIRQVKRVNPSAEIIVYVYTPLPADSVPDSQRLKLAPLRDAHGAPVEFPKTPEEWTERRWVDYACHADAPWLSDRLRQRIRDFVTVLRCRFPTVQDTRSPGWAKGALRRGCAEELALCIAPLRSAMGAHGVAEPHRPARSARHEPLSCGAPALARRTDQLRRPQRALPRLLHIGSTLVDTAAAAASCRRARHGRSSRAWSPAGSCDPASRFTSWLRKPRAPHCHAAAPSARSYATQSRRIPCPRLGFRARGTRAP